MPGGGARRACLSACHSGTLCQNGTLVFFACLARVGGLGREVIKKPT